MYVKHNSESIESIPSLKKSNNIQDLWWKNTIPKNFLNRKKTQT